MKTLQLKLSGMHCASCSLLIEGALEDMGVTAHASYAKQVVDVTFDEGKTTLAKITSAIRSLGYDVTV